MTGTLINALTFLAQQPGTAPGQQPATSSTMLIIWAIVLIGVALALFIIEVMIPSGGIIGMLSAISLIAGVVMFWQVNTTLGLAAAAFSLAALPFLIAIAIRVLPDTPLMRIMTLGTIQRRTTPGPAPEDEALADEQPATTTQSPDGELAPETKGQAISELRPVGTCIFDGKRHECLSTSGVIEPGDPVRIVAIDGMNIKVVKA